MKLPITSVIFRVPVYLVGLSLLVLVGGVVVARVVGSRVKPSTIANPQMKTPERVTISTGQETKRVQPGEVELITLTPTGFEPNEITRPAGKFLFGVNNRSGVSALAFSLLGEKGASAGEKQMVREKVWRKVVDLQPGRYLLSVADHPKWQCQITITQGK